MSDHSVPEAIPYASLRKTIWGERLESLPMPKGLEDKKCFVIDRDSRIYALGCGDDAADMRFTLLASAVWKVIDSAERECMVEFWRHITPTESPYLTQEWAPEIALRDTWYTRSDDDNSACAVAAVVFNFHRATMSKWSDECVKTIVAHELAHALAKATGREFRKAPANVGEAEQRRTVCDHFGKHPAELNLWLVRINRTLTQVFQYATSEEEQFVDEVMKRWGFDPDLLRTNCESLRDSDPSKPLSKSDA
jgi:hypothetical protein